MRLFAMAATAALAFTACGAVESRADQYSAGYRAKRHAHISHPTRWYHRLPFGVGGYLFGNQHTPYIYHTGGYSYSPTLNNQTFWERVETQSQYPIR
jgi:hypothetical protein